MPGSWGYEIGPDSPLEVCDQLWVSRYILNRIAEDLAISVSFSTKPVKGKWSGNSLKVSFSSVEMRQDGGYDHILSAVNKLSESHSKFMEIFGEQNLKKFTKKSKTSTLNDFTFAVGLDDVCIKIPSLTYKRG